MFIKLCHQRGKSIMSRGNSRVLVYSALFLLCAMLVSLSSRADWQVEGLEFSRVLIMGSADVEISQGDVSELLVRGSESDLDVQPFFVDGDTLVLGRSKKRHHDFSGLKFKLVVTDLEHLQVSGSGEVYVKPLTVEDFYVSVEGSGEVKLYGVRGRDLTIMVSGSGEAQAVDLVGVDVQFVVSGSGELFVGKLKATTLETSISGSGDVSVQKKGEVNELKINIAGSGDVDLEDLAAESVRVNIAGSGTASVRASKQLDVNIMGSGDVYYHGSPDISQSILGSGDVIQQ
jgi:hypothetical protein